MCNKHWKTKPKVHAKDVELAFLLTPPSWIAVVTRPQNRTISSKCFQIQPIDCSKPQNPKPV